MRDPGKISKEEKENIRIQVHKEAEEVKWHFLNNKEKSKYYNKWSERFNIGREYLKDRIMKGFDVSQGIPLKGELSIQKEIEELLIKHKIALLPQFKVGEKYRVDLVFGFYQNFPTHVVEIERVDNWLHGFTQVLGYAADYFNQAQKMVQPVLLIFGHVSAKKVERIRQTCDFARVVLCHYNLTIKGKTNLKILDIFEYLGLEQGVDREKKE